MFDQTHDFANAQGPSDTPAADAFAPPAFRTASGGIDYARAVQAGRMERSLVAHRALARLAAFVRLLARR